MKNNPEKKKTRLPEVARVIRSKNAGPFELTFDIIFRDKASYSEFRRRDVLSRETISSLFRIPGGDIHSIVYFDLVNAIKFTIRRAVPSGCPGDSDIYGAQQHAPLLTLEW
ncbi:DUF4387 domain-containing protein [bacterium]|nr:DUF4387 domain-containing protein [bacterium]